MYYDDTMENNTNNEEVRKEDLDSFIIETYKHKNKVNEIINMVCVELQHRGITHDNSKLKEPELSGYSKYVNKLADMQYMSNEYKESLNKMKPYIDNHYENNRHHPEHHRNGITDMNLIDIIEMVCDWKAAVEKHKSGNIYESLDINKNRFNYGEELHQIIKNTIDFLNSK